MHGRGYAASDHCNVVCAGDIDIEEKADEVAVVEVADAVVNPRAMVIYGPHWVKTRGCNEGIQVGHLPIRSTHLPKVRVMRRILLYIILTTQGRDKLTVYTLGNDGIGEVYIVRTSDRTSGYQTVSSLHILQESPCLVAYVGITSGCLAFSNKARTYPSIGNTPRICHHT